MAFAALRTLPAPVFLLPSPYSGCQFPPPRFASPFRLFRRHMPGGCGRKAQAAVRKRGQKVASANVWRRRPPQGAGGKAKTRRGPQSRAPRLHCAPQFAHCEKERGRVCNPVPFPCYVVLFHPYGRQGAPAFRKCKRRHPYSRPYAGAVLCFLRPIYAVQEEMYRRSASLKKAGVRPRRFFTGAGRRPGRPAPSRRSAAAGRMQHELRGDRAPRAPVRSPPPATARLFLSYDLHGQIGPKRKNSGLCGPGAQSPRV